MATRTRKKLSCWLMVQRRAEESGPGESRDKDTGREMEKCPNSRETDVQNEVGTKSGDRIELGPAGRTRGSLLVARCCAGYGEGFIEWVGAECSRTSGSAIAWTRSLSITRLRYDQLLCLHWIMTSAHRLQHRLYFGYEFLPLIRHQPNIPS
jgi:hypothetical protein